MALTVLNPEKAYEIVDGQPEEKDMGGARHGGVSARLLTRLGSYVEAHRLGGVYGPDTSFQIGANERLPDVAFVAADRIPHEGEPEGIWPFAPDLAVEILSPTDLYEKVSGKTREYFAAGVRQVWLISPEHQTVTMYQSPTQLRILTAEVEDAVLQRRRYEVEIDEDVIRVLREKAQQCDVSVSRLVSDILRQQLLSASSSPSSSSAS